MLAFELPAVALVVVGCVGLVESATTLADHWSLLDAVVGFVILAVATSIPNAYRGSLRLGRARLRAGQRALNSNSINLLGGLVIPAIFISAAPFGGMVAFNFCALLIMTGFFRAPGRRRWRAGIGLALIAGYLAIVAVNVAAG